jgi:hypothetical protein
MSRARSLLFVLGCALGAAACEGKSTAPRAPSSPPPVDSAAATAAAPEPTGTTDVAGAPGWRPAKCAGYSYTPEDCHGSAENPNCTQSFEIHPDGKVVKVFDDIMTRGSYESTESTVTVRVPEMKFEETLTVEDGGKVLVGAGGARYQRADCP